MTGGSPPSTSSRSLRIRVLASCLVPLREGEEGVLGRGGLGWVMAGLGTPAACRGAMIAGKSLGASRDRECEGAAWTSCWRVARMRRPRKKAMGKGRAAIAEGGMVGGWVRRRSIDPVVDE